jgi:predicted PurR-regulated permease PerM
MVNSAGSLLSGFSALAWTLLVAFIGFYYLLRDGSRLRAVVIKGMPMPDVDAELIVKKLQAIIVSVVRVTIVMSCAYGIAVGFDFAIFGIPNSALWGGVSVFTSFIPVIGAYITTVPGAIFLALTGHVAKAIGELIFISACGFLFENFLRPRLLHRGTNVHPLLILLSLIGGFSVFGPIGMLVGPIVLSFLVALIEIAPEFIVGKEGSVERR